MNFSAVVLPEPDAPTTAVKVPASKPMVASATAKVAPPSKDLLTLSISMSRGFSIFKQLRWKVDIAAGSTG